MSPYSPELSAALSFLGVSLLIGVHILTPSFRFLKDHAGPWVSASAGVAIAYVFVDILPLLAKQQDKLFSTTATGWLQYLEHHVYILAMAGFAFHYALDLNHRLDPVQARELPRDGRITRRGLPAIISNMAYVFLIGYMIGEKWSHTAEPALFFAVAMAIHFIGLNHLVMESFPDFYRRWLRWELSLVTLAGWSLGMLTQVSDAVFLLGFSWLAGGIIVIAMSVELPRVGSRRADFLAFLGAILVFTVLILLAESSIPL